MGGPQFCPPDMVRACRQVVTELGGSAGIMRDHARGSGWCSHSVLAQVLQNTIPPAYRMLLRRVHVSVWDALVARDDILGVLINMNNYHWACICKEADGVFYVDSRYSPVLIEEAEWTRILLLRPDAFCVVKADSDFD